MFWRFRTQRSQNYSHRDPMKVQHMEHTISLKWNFKYFHHNPVSYILLCVLMDAMKVRDYSLHPCLNSRNDGLDPVKVETISCSWGLPQANKKKKKKKP